MNRSLLSKPTGLPFLLLSCCASTMLIVAEAPRAPAASREPAVSAAPALPSVAAPDPASKRAPGDTLYVLGGPERGDGKFQADHDRMLPDDEGWYPLGQGPEPPYWHVDTFNAELLDPLVPGNHAMWCGRYFPPCDGEPENPGYGNLVQTFLGWNRPVPDPLLPVTVRLTARLNHDTEPGYDYLFLEVEHAAGWQIVRTWEGSNRSGDPWAGGPFVPVDVDASFVVQPADYRGEQGDEVRLRWRFESDGGWSDEDCLFPTDGAAQVDNIVVSFDQGAGPSTVTTDDFEPGSLASWAPENPLCSLARVRALLPDVGVCGTNPTPQVAFIDDGSACFSDGTYGTTWTYGPEGRVAYCPGNSGTHSDAFLSPPIVLPPDLADYDGARLEWDAYVHDPLVQVTVTWQLRTSQDGGATWSAWGNHGFSYEQNGPEYRRFSFDVTEQIPAGADLVQVSLGVQNFPTWSGNCNLVTPAPYYDNVALKLFERAGPEVFSQGGVNLFQSAFPAGGTLDPADPGSHSVRLDSRNDDHVSCGVAVHREGAVRTGPPELHWRLSPNPAYDAHRGFPPPNPVLGDSIGTLRPIDGPVGAKFAFDLPDTGFFFPGDVLHYYIEARDDAAGDIGVATLPADTTGFSSFPGQPGYVPGLFPQHYEVRALPTLHDPAAGTQPAILLWLRDPDLAELNEWLTAMANLGYRHGIDFDLLKSPRTDTVEFTAAQLAGYEVLIYGSGRLKSAFNSAEGEVAALEGWLALGGKKALLCGDNVVYRFRPNYAYWYEGTLGISAASPSTADDVRPYIDGQAAPSVLPVAGNPLGLTAEAIADGTCRYNLFDAMVPAGSGQTILQWGAPGGSPGGYVPVAGVYNVRADWGAQIVTLPFDLAVLRTPAGQGGDPTAARTRLLGEILTFFGAGPGGLPTDVPPASHFTISTYPNPFNPRLNFEYDLPRPGELSLRIYDLRGRLVRLLRRGPAPAGPGRAVWEGRDDEGRLVAAGVYIYEARADGETTRRKVALIR